MWGFTYYAQRRLRTRTYTFVPSARFSRLTSKKRSEKLYQVSGTVRSSMIHHPYEHRPSPIHIPSIVLVVILLYLPVLVHVACRYQQKLDKLHQLVKLDELEKSKSSLVPFHSRFGPTSGLTSINMRRNYALQHSPASSMQSSQHARKPR